MGVIYPAAAVAVTTHPAVVVPFHCAAVITAAAESLGQRAAMVRAGARAGTGAGATVRFLRAADGYT